MLIHIAFYIGLQAFFIKLPEVLSQFTEALDTPIANQVPSGQLQSMATR